MAILVTGGAGYIGSAMVDLLCERKETVVVLDDLRRGHRDAVDESVPFYQGSTGDRALVRRIFTNTISKPAFTLPRWLMSASRWPIQNFISSETSNTG